MKYFKHALKNQTLPEPTSFLKPLNLVKMDKLPWHYAPSSLAWPHRYFGTGPYWALVLQAITLCAKKCCDHMQLAPFTQYHITGFYCKDFLILCLAQFAILKSVLFL